MLMPPGWRALSFNRDAEPNGFVRAKIRSFSDTGDIFNPSMNVPLLRHPTRTSACRTGCPSASTSRAYRPRRLIAEIAGDVQVPTSIWLIEKVMSERPVRRRSAPRRTLHGKLHGIHLLIQQLDVVGELVFHVSARVNQISPAAIRPGSRKVSGTSRRPMIRQVEAEATGRPSPRSWCYRPRGIATSSRCPSWLRRPS